MIEKDLTELFFELKDARKLNNQIMLECNDASIIDRACKLSEIIFSMQAHLVSIQADLMQHPIVDNEFK
jgi:hypothetical protein